tara:strand:- start:9556 stop:9795 length:240 start_codon:yes stop_codon:yes gene_type:complete
MSWLEDFRNKKKENNNNKEERNRSKQDKVEKRREFRLEKIREVTAKFYAVAAKRKWLVFMIIAAIAAYLIIFKGGFSLL